MIKLALASALTLLVLGLAQPASSPVAETPNATGDELVATHCTWYICIGGGELLPSRTICESECGGPGTCRAVQTCR